MNISCQSANQTSGRSKLDLQKATELKAMISSWFTFAQFTRNVTDTLFKPLLILES